jgi:hypothetical protein
MPSPWLWVHQVFRRLIETVTNNPNEQWLVLVDTNPSFSIYTEVAISAVNRLIVPVNADDASRVATNAMFTLIYGANPPHPVYGTYTYASRADQFNLPRPLGRLVKYFGIFASGMKNAWKGLNYVEICSGPGRCITRDNRTEMDGTALSIVTHPVFPQLKKALFIDASVQVVEALNHFMDEYLSSLNREGYIYTDFRPVEHYYHLLFASRSPKGLEFWLKACSIAPNNQRELF